MLNRKQTKIIATISDKNCEPKLIKDMFESGMNVARLNTAHQTPEVSLEIINIIRNISDKIAVLIDTKGPEVRTSGMDKELIVKKDDLVYITKNNISSPHFSVSYEYFYRDVPIHSSVLIDDGEMELKVIAKKEECLECKVMNDGVIKNKKSVNVPDIHLNLPALSNKDREYIKFAAENDVDFIAHSFVRNKNDVIEVQKIIDQYKSSLKIIAKIENREGVNNINEILDYSFGVMIARGDLGIEIPAAEVPLIQKKIINQCMKRAKPVITATQMLHSMIDNPRPTRAEVSDVANAVYDGTDALMLSGETAYGRYSLEAVRTMANIAKVVEQNKPKLKNLPVFSFHDKVRNYLSKAAVSAALELPVKAIIVDTESGLSARIVSSYRGHIPVYAKSHNKKVLRELSLSYGIYPSYIEIPETTDELVASALYTLLNTGELREDDLIVILAGTPYHSEGSNFIEINTVDLCLHKRNNWGQRI